jgi:Cupin-like domain
MPDTVRTVAAADASALAETLAQRTQPVVLQGLVAHWPLVQAGLESSAACSHYLSGFYGDATVDAWRGAAAIQGRFFYNAAFDGFNFERQRLRLDAVLRQLEAQAQATEPEAWYVGSTTVDTCLPGLRAANDLPTLAPHHPLMSLWLGNRTQVAAHHDVPDNLACVAAGRRRFTLFPPEELNNLYVGPLDFTPAGQPISLVDFSNPDFTRFPKARTAWARAQVAELGPGDALFIPSMWWHQVQALAPFNLLINYWWRDTPAFMDSPMNALMHALLCVRDLPPEQRSAWAQMFDHYVFNANPATASHLVPEARGVLAPLDPEAARALRVQLLRKLNR